MGPIRTVGNKHDTGVQPPSAATAGKDELDTSDVTGSDLNSSQTNNSFSVDSPPHKKVKLDDTPMDSSTAGFSPPTGLEPVGAGSRTNRLSHSLRRKEMKTDKRWQRITPLRGHRAKGVS
jgi:hypothetical protein